MFNFSFKRQKTKEISGEERLRLREIWQQTEVLVTCDCPQDKITDVLADFSSDDLHALAHGESVEDGVFAEAIARHPLCDWGTAFEILHSYSAASYQSYWREGKAEDSFGDVDQTLFRAFSTIAERASSEGFASRKFNHNMERHERTDAEGRPNPYHPSNWVKWSLPERVLTPTQGARPKPTVVLDCGRVLLEFNTWLQQQHPIQ